MGMQFILEKVAIYVVMGFVCVMCGGVFAQSGPVGFWKFDDGSGITATDSSGNGNHGTLTYMAPSPWIDGKYSHALSFNENADWVTIANNATLQITGDLTISLWVKPATVGVSRCNLVHKDFGGEYSVVLEADGSVRLFQGRGTDSGEYYGPIIIPSGSIVNDQWQHIAVTRDMTNRYLRGYVNGELKATVAYPENANYSPPLSSVNPVIIGAGYTYDFDGEIDSVRIYDRTLSTHEILLQSMKCDYVVYWKLNESSGVTVNDSGSCGNDGTLVNGIATPWVTGKISGGVDLGGSSDYISINNNSSLQLTGDLTIAMWIKPVNVGNERISLVDKSYGGEFSVIIDLDGAIRLVQGQSKNSGYFFGSKIIAAGNVVNGEWQHIAVTRDMTNNQLIGYYNGVKMTTCPYDPTADYYPPAATTDPVIIGDGYLYDFDGLIDEVVITNRVFSTMDVQKLYQLSDSERMHLDMNEGQGATVTDLSGYGNHAEFSNYLGESDWVAGHINPDGYFRHSLDFNDSNDYLQCASNSSLQLTGDLTIAMWIKPANVGNERISLIDKSYGGEFSVTIDIDGSIRLVQGQSKNSGYFFGPKIIAAGNVVNDEWQHIAVTRDMTNNQLIGYYNGVRMTTYPYDPTADYYPPAATTDPVIIGDGYLYDFDGLMDQVQIFDRVLSEDEIEDMQFNLLSAYANQTYYTTEDAVAVCTIDAMPESELDDCCLVAINSSGTLIGTNNTPENEPNLTFSTSTLSTGNNTVTIELRRNSGERVFAYDLDVKKLASKIGYETKVDLQNGRVYRDGSAFFPIGLVMYGITESDSTDFTLTANAGFNSIIQWYYYADPTEATTYLENADTEDLFVLTKHESYTDTKLSTYRLNENFWNYYVIERDNIIDGVSYAKQESNLVGYYSFDEPYVYQLEAGLDLYERTNTEDGYHPTYVNYSSIIYEGEDYTNWCDILGVDPYWYPPRVSGNTRSSIDWVTQCVSVANTRVKQDHKALWIMPMSEYYSGCRKRGLTGDEQRTQTYLCLIHGAKGIFYFKYPCLHKDSWDTITGLAHELADLAPSLVTLDLDQSVSYSESSTPVTFDPANGQFADVQVRLFKAPADESFDYVLLAANTREYSVDVDYEISLLGESGTISRLFDAATYNISDGGFSDTLAAYATRAYTFSSVSTDPVTIDVDMDPGTATAETIHPVTGRTGCTNLMPNPSLENATLTNWPDYCFPWYAIPRITEANQGWGLESSGAYHGSKCLKMTRISSLNGFYFYLAPDANNDDYTFSVYLKADQAGRQVKLSCSGASSTTITLTTSWARYSYTCNFPSGLSSYTVFRVELQDNDSTVWADAVQVEKASTASTFTIN